MPITYDPKDGTAAWPEGEYQAVLASVEDGTSKTSGAPMQTWTWEVYSPGGRKQTIKDYVVVPAATFKIRQFAAALGKHKEYEAGDFQADDQIGESVTAVLKIEKQDGYDDKNKIANVKPWQAQTTRPAPQKGPAIPKRQPAPAPANPISDTQEFNDADIPF